MTDKTELANNVNTYIFTHRLNAYSKNFKIGITIGGNRFDVHLLKF